MVRRLTIGVVVALLLTGCSGSSEKSSGTAAPPTSQATVAAPSSTEPPPPTTTTAFPTFMVATATVPRVQVFDGPGASEPARTLANPNPTYGTPRVLLVRQEQGDWLEVYLPQRPNGSAGWIRRGDVEMASHNWRIVVDIAAHKLTAYNGADVFLDAPVAVGSSATPTPIGLFYTTELISVLPSQRAAYGPFAFGLSGYSEVLFDFGGGDGQFGIHGTSDTGSIGRSVSNGCIRLDNDSIVKLREAVPMMGIPVEIRA